MGFITSKAKAIFRLSTRVTKKLAGAAWDNREELAKVARAGAGLAVSAGKALAVGAAATGVYVYNHRAEIAEGTVLAGKAAIAAGKGAAKSSWDAASAAIFRDSRVAELRDQLHQQGLRYREAIASDWQSTPGAESLAVGGSLLVDIIRTGKTPEDVQKAYELAYPHVAENVSFADEAAHLHGQELVGFVNGLQKLFYLPEVHTDFILAVIGEEFGLLGVIAVVGMFFLLVQRAFCIAMAAPDIFGRYLALGIAALFGIEVIINMGVVTGMLPTKGLALPFLSYGGSSLLVSLFAVGILLNISSGLNLPGNLPFSIRKTGLPSKLNRN